MTFGRLCAGATGLCLALVMAGPSHANELLRCRAITSTAERLACYDALAGSLVAPGPAAVPAPSLSRAVPAPAPVPLVPAAPAVPAVPAESGFGLPSKAAAVAERNDIESMIPGAFEGWRPRETFALANGQVWQIADESEGAYSRRDPKVRIERGRAGGYFLTIEGVAQTPRVRRLK